MSVYSFTTLVEKAQAEDGPDRIHFLNEVCKDSVIIRNVLNVIKLDEESSRLIHSSVLNKAANEILEDFNFNSYLGKNIDNWAITNLIKTTKKSAVFKAKPTEEYEDNVAIKISSPSFKVISRGKSENQQAHYMALLKHPNIVEVKAAATTDDGLSYLVMEYLPGFDIVQHCENNEMTYKQRLGIFRELCEGTVHMHKYISHGDLKPENVLMDKHGVPKIFDFDLSHPLDISLNASFDYTNIHGNTEPYAAPEQLEKPPSVSPLSDIHALGYILFEMLTGSNDFIRDKYLLKKKYKLDAMSYAELCSVISTATQKLPVNRYRTTDELLNDVNAIIKGDYFPSSYKASSGELSNKFIQRRKVALSLVCLFFSVILFSSTMIWQEKNEAKAALDLMIKSQDPRQVNMSEEFDKRANTLLVSESEYDVQGYYELLIGYGDAYLGSGNAQKSISFFNKALLLYADNLSQNKLKAVNKLLLAYYVTVEPQRIFDLISDYIPFLLQKNLSNPELIEMLIIMTDIYSKYEPVLEEINGFKSVSVEELKAILDSVDLSAFQSEGSKIQIQASILLNNAVFEYYSLITTDAMSVTSYIDEKAMFDTIKSLKAIKRDLFVAITMLERSKQAPYKLANAYIWIARVEGALKNNQSSAKYAKKGLDLTKKIFGSSHLQLADSYLRLHTIYRYTDPIKSLDYVKKANEIAQNEFENLKVLSTLYRMFLGNAYLNVGAYKKSKSIFLEMTLEAKEFQGENDVATIYQNLYGLAAELFMYNNLALGKHAHDVINAMVFVEKYYQELYPDAHYMSLLTSELKIVNNDMNSAIIDFTNGITQALNVSEDASTISTSNLLLAERCIRITNCDASGFIDEVITNYKWSSFDDSESTEKAHYFIRTADVLLQLNRNDEAILMLKEVKVIVDKHNYENNLLKSSWHVVAMRYHKANSNLVKAKEHGLLALQATIYNLGIDSPITTELIDITSQ